MKAIGYRAPLPIGDPKSLESLEIDAPTPRPKDVVVRVKAISVNPVDTKIRAGRAPKDGRPVILGWDAVGIVESTGPDAKTFSVGDRVYYAGAIDRPGANSELHAVDERIIARAPRSLTDEEAAALPLTSITAYELLFDRLRIARDGGDGETLLIIGGAGGVGSILIQLARTLTKLRVVATASRPVSISVPTA
jgi:zinc-binding alcohol dehydrogenase family protein